MIRQLSEMPSLIRSLLSDVETEVVEYKEAKRGYDFEKIGKYFSRSATRQTFGMPNAAGSSSG